MNQIADNLAGVQQRIRQAAGSRAKDVTLVAVTKTHPLETVIKAYQAGMRHFGENRSEEGAEKTAAFKRWRQAQPNVEAAHWHFIGHVQSRQARAVLESDYSLIHSVDSLKLAKRLNRLIEQYKLTPVDILLQCNVSGEETKSGFQLHRWQTDAGQLNRFVEAVKTVAGLKHVNICGLMTMAPWFDDAELTRPIFRRLAALRQKLQSERPDLNWQHLSMGMTDDFEVALQEGATMIRVGRAIFGERHYT